MDIQTLRGLLAIKDGQVRLSTNTVPAPAMKAFLLAYYQNQDILITGAKPGEGDSDNTIVIEGKASAFLRVDQARVRAEIVWLPDKQDVRLTIRYELIGDQTGMTTWTFGQSFPNLPVVQNFTRSLSDPGVSPLTELRLRNSYFYVTTQRQQESVHGATIEEGINFVGICLPPGSLQMLETLSGQDPAMVLYGTIQLPPIQGATIPPLPETPKAYPWNVAWTVYGISLQGRVGPGHTFGDKLEFQAPTFRLYSPADADWLSHNPSYEPAMALAGTIYAPGAGISDMFTSELLLGVPSVVLTNDFSGVTLNKLAELVDFAGTDSSGGDGLLASLPDELKKLGDALGKIELMNATIALSVGLSSGIKVKYCYLTVGLPDAHWETLGGIRVKDIEATFYILYPFDSSQRSLRVNLSGTLVVEGVPIEIGTDIPDFYMYGQLVQTESLPLSTFNAYLPSGAHLTDLEVNELYLNLMPNQYISLGFVIAEKTPWVIDIGKNGIKLEDIEIYLNKDLNTGGKSGSLSGWIVIDDNVSVQAAYDLSGDFSIRGGIDRISLSSLIGWLVSDRLHLPFDLAFTQSTLLIDKTGSSYDFALGTELDGFGSLALEVRKTDQGWGFAAGLEIVQRASALSGLSALSIFEDIFPYDRALLAFSSIKDPKFQFPDMSKFQNPTIKTKKIELPKQAGGMQAGIYVYADTTLSRHKVTQSIAKLLKIPQETELGFALFVGENPAENAKLTLYMTSQINTVTSVTAQFGGMIQNGDIGFFLMGTLNTQIQGQPTQFDVVLVVVENGLFVAGDMLNKGDKPLQFGVLQIRDVAVELGISFEGLPSIGFAAELDVEDFDSSIAIFFDLENPVNSMLAGSISDVSLLNIADAMAGDASVPEAFKPVLEKVAIKGTHTFQMDKKTAGDLDNYRFEQIAAAFKQAGGVELPTSSGNIHLVVNAPGKVWHLTDMTRMNHYELTLVDDRINVSLEAQVYFVLPDSGVTIANTTFPQGMKVNGKLELLFIEEELSVDIEPSKGISIDAEMSPIVIGSKTFFSLTGANGKEKPQLSIASYPDTNRKSPYNDPHLIINAELHLLGATFLIEVYFDLQQEAFHFEVKEGSFLGNMFDIHAHFSSLTDFGAGAEVKIGVDQDLDFGALGHLHIQADVAATGDLGVQKSGTSDDVNIFAKTKLDFQFMGQDFHILEFELDVSTEAFAHYTSIAVGKIKAFFADIFNDVKKWLSYVFKKLLQGVDKVGEVLKNVFKQGWKEAAQLMKDVGYIADEITKEIAEGFKMAMDEVEGFVNDLFKVCSASTAYTMAEPPVASLSGLHVLVDLSQTEKGQQLLYYYYLHQEQVKRILEQSPGLRDELHALSGPQTEGNPIGDTVFFLLGLRRYADAELTASLDKAIVLLVEHHQTYGWRDYRTFLRQLNGGEASGV